VSPTPSERTIVWWSAGLHDLPKSDAWVDEREAKRFSSMEFTKRREEAFLARYTAKATVASFLGRPTEPGALRAITVTNASDGAPEVLVDGSPAGLVIAMTDRADWAVAAVLAGDDRIGCDLELVEPRSDLFVQDYFTSYEQAATRKSADPALTANLIWSGKESALKALRTGLRRDTRSVEVRPGVTAGDGWNPLTVVAAEGTEFPGWWVRHGSFILTVAAACPTAVPRSLEEPPPLATATPGHSWMRRPRSEP
jgi:4'-phosphopantetheinyl transferase